MAEKSVGRRATTRRSIEPGRIPALGRIVNGSGPDGLVASDRLLNMRDERARPLMQRFDELLRQHAATREIFGLP
jgi:hypothetical protein